MVVCMEVKKKTQTAALFRNREFTQPYQTVWKLELFVLLLFPVYGQTVKQKH